MLNKAELEFQYITNSLGKHSFQIVAMPSNKIVLKAQIWFDTKEDMQTYANTIRDAFIKSKHAGAASSLPNGNIEYVLNEEQDVTRNQTMLVAAIVSHNLTGKFGVAIYTHEGALVMLPEKWFNNEDEAQASITEDAEFKEKVIAAAKTYGFCTPAFLEKPIANFPISAPIEEKPKEKVKFPFFNKPGNPSLN